MICNVNSLNYNWGWEPWFSGYVSELINQRLLVRIPILDAANAGNIICQHYKLPYICDESPC